MKLKDCPFCGAEFDIELDTAARREGVKEIKEQLSNINQYDKSSVMYNIENLINKITHADCMDIMKDMPDKYIDLAIVDPPYGAGEVADFIPKRKGSNRLKNHKSKGWNTKPNNKYFKELFRVSKNQIIWGGNYFTDMMPVSRGWIFWNKCYENTYNFSAGELAWTSFDMILKMFTKNQRVMPHMQRNIHPTQKPIQLYRWILQQYAKTDQLILDTHSGSGSLACACHLEKYDFIAIEKDIDYHRDSVARLNELRSQGVLF